MLSKNKAKAIYSSWCKICQRNYAKQHYIDNTQYYLDKTAKNQPEYDLRNKTFMLNYLAKHPCVDCGEIDLDVLQFDHVDLVGSKAKRVGHYLRGSLQKLIREIEKCEVRCANCHVRRTRKQLGWERVI